MEKLKTLVIGDSFKKKFKSLLYGALVELRNYKEACEEKISEAIFDVTKLLKLRKHKHAYKKVGIVIERQNVREVYDLTIDYLTVLINCIYLFGNNRDCPQEFLEVVSSFLFAAPRFRFAPCCTNNQRLRNFLLEHFGPNLAAQYIERNKCWINAEIIQKLSKEPPPKKIRMKVLKEIAEKEHIVLNLEEASTSTKGTSDLIGESYGLSVPDKKGKKKCNDVVDDAQTKPESAPHEAAVVELPQFSPHGPDHDIGVENSSNDPENKKLGQELKRNDDGSVKKGKKKCKDVVVSEKKGNKKCNDVVDDAQRELESAPHEAAVVELPQFSPHGPDHDIGVENSSNDPENKKLGQELKRNDDGSVKKGKKKCKDVVVSEKKGKKKCNDVVDDAQTELKSAPHEAAVVELPQFSPHGPDHDIGVENSSNDLENKKLGQELKRNDDGSVKKGKKKCKEVVFSERKGKKKCNDVVDDAQAEPESAPAVVELPQFSPHGLDDIITYEDIESWMEKDLPVTFD